MYLRIGSRIINTANLVEARVSPATAERATSVEIVTTAAYTIELTGDEAEAFLIALPTYSPVLDEEE